MHRILVVEDNPTNQLLSRRLLAAFDCTVEIARNGSEALDACDETAFDLILMDVQMPVLDGYVATAKLRERQQLTGSPRTPIIGLSARAITGDREAALAAGMDDYLTKPIDLDELREVLAHWVPYLTHRGESGVSPEVAGVRQTT